MELFVHICLSYIRYEVNVVRATKAKAKVKIISVLINVTLILYRILEKILKEFLYVQMQYLQTQKIQFIPIYWLKSNISPCVSGIYISSFPDTDLDISIKI